MSCATNYLAVAVPWSQARPINMRENNQNLRMVHLMALGNLTVKLYITLYLTCIYSYREKAVLISILKE